MEVLFELAKFDSYKEEIIRKKYDCIYEGVKQQKPEISQIYWV